MITPLSICTLRDFTLSIERDNVEKIVTNMSKQHCFNDSLPVDTTNTIESFISGESCDFLNLCLEYLSDTRT